MLNISEDRSLRGGLRQVVNTVGLDNGGHQKAGGQPKRVSLVHEIIQ